MKRFNKNNLVMPRILWLYECRVKGKQKCCGGEHCPYKLKGLPKAYMECYCFDTLASCFYESELKRPVLCLKTLGHKTNFSFCAACYQRNLSLIHEKGDSIIVCECNKCNPFSNKKFHL